MGDCESEGIRRHPDSYRGERGTSLLASTTSCDFHHAATSYSDNSLALLKQVAICPGVSPANSATICSFVFSVARYPKIRLTRIRVLIIHGFPSKIVGVLIK